MCNATETFLKQELKQLLYCCTGFGPQHSSMGDQLTYVKRYGKSQVTQKVFAWQLQVIFQGVKNPSTHPGFTTTTMNTSRLMDWFRKTSETTFWGAQLCGIKRYSSDYTTGNLNSNSSSDTCSRWQGRMGVSGFCQLTHPVGEVVVAHHRGGTKWKHQVLPSGV